MLAVAGHLSIVAGGPAGAALVHGADLVLVADAVACRGLLVRELCSAMRCDAALVHEAHHVSARLQLGDVGALVADFDAFGRRVLAEVAARDVALPVLLTADEGGAGRSEVSRVVYGLGLTQVTIIPRPLTTARLRRFLTECGLMRGQPRFTHTA